MPYNRRAMPKGRITRQQVSKRTTSVTTTVTTHVAPHPPSQPIVTTVPPPPPFVCAPGMLHYNATLCVPCPPGWRCLYGMPSPCAPGSWSAHGQSACQPCTECPNGTRLLVPCGGSDEGSCHACPKGFALDAPTATCVPPSHMSAGAWAMLDPTVAAVVLFLFVLEMVVWALCVRRSSYNMYGRVDDESGGSARSARNRVSSKRWAWLRGETGADRTAGQGRGCGFEPYLQPSGSGGRLGDKELLRACSWFDPRSSGVGGGGNGGAPDEASVRLIGPTGPGPALA